MSYNYPKTKSSLLSPWFFCFLCGKSGLADPPPPLLEKSTNSFLTLPLFRHNYIKNGQIKWFLFSFLRLGLRVIQFIIKFRPPWIFKSPNLDSWLFCFYPPWHIVWNFRVFLIMMPSLGSTGTRLGIYGQLFINVKTCQALESMTNNWKFGLSLSWLWWC